VATKKAKQKGGGGGGGRKPRGEKAPGRHPKNKKMPLKKKKKKQHVGIRENGVGTPRKKVHRAQKKEGGCWGGEQQKKVH